MKWIRKDVGYRKWYHMVVKRICYLILVKTGKRRCSGYGIYPNGVKCPGMIVTGKQVLKNIYA